MTADDRIRVVLSGSPREVGLLPCADSFFVITERLKLTY